jgi:hypothetical protein
MLSNSYSLLLTPIVVILIFTSTSIIPSYGLYSDPKEIKSHLNSFKENIRDLANSQVHVIVSNHLNKVIEFELSHENRTIISTPIQQGATLYDRVPSGDDYIVEITPEGEKPLKAVLDLERCIAVTVIESPFENQAEIYLAQCSTHLTSSIDRMDHENNRISFPQSFEFIK